MCSIIDSQRLIIFQVFPLRVPGMKREIVRTILGNVSFLDLWIECLDTQPFFHMKRNLATDQIVQRHRGFLLRYASGFIRLCTQISSRFDPVTGSASTFFPGHKSSRSKMEKVRRTSTFLRIFQLFP